MPKTIEVETAARLATALGELAVEIDQVEVEIFDVAVPSYGEQPRPTSITRLHGAGETGRGEHVGWSRSAHEDFHQKAKTAIPRGRMSIAALSERLEGELPTPYDRAALEAAAIDLALRQSESRLETLLALQPRATRYVLSLAPDGDPVESVRRTLGPNTELQVKIDADPRWKRPDFDALAETSRVAIVDWKKGGDSATHRTALQSLPRAIQEDPGANPLAAPAEFAHHLGIDGPFTHARALAGAPRPFAANIKPARMGGVLEALRGAAYCARHGIQIYFGGMFELGIGRHQLLALASLLAPDGPNDIAPIARTSQETRRPNRLLPPAEAGFG